MKNIANILTKALLLLCMMVSTTMVWAEEPDPTPTDITTADQLKTALTGEHSDEPITVTLASNIDISETIELTNKNTITLDLAGFTITATGHRALWVKNGNLTIQSTGTEGRIYVVGTIDPDQSVIRVGYGAKNDADISESASLKIGEKVTISTDLCYGVTIFGKNTSQTLEVDGKISTKVRPAISGHGDFSGTTITVGEKAVISTTDDVAIYHPQSGGLTVNGKVTGASGIEIKGGELTVGSDATITATGEPTHTANNDGTSTRGYAIAIVENGLYAGVSNVNISKDATITGPIAVLKDSDKKPESPEITFAPEGLQMQVKVTDSNSKNLGQYMSLNEAFRVEPAAGSTVTLYGDCSLTSTIATTNDLTLALNGHNVTSNGQRAFLIKSGDVTISGTGVIEAKGAIDANSSVMHLGDDEGSDKTAGLTIEADVTVKTNGCHGVTAYGSATTETLTVAGKIETDGYPAISGNRADQKNGAAVTVEAGAEISATNAVAIYHPQTGALTVNGKVTGAGGIEIKAGSLTVGSAAVIKKTGTPAHTANNEAPSSTGYAIAIVENSNLVTSVEIADGATINGIVAELQDSSVDGFSPSYSGKYTTKVAGINNDKYFSLDDAISVVPATGTVKLLGDYVTESGKPYVMEVEKTYTLDLNGHYFTGNGCAAIQIAGGHVTIKNSGTTGMKVTVSRTTTDPVIKLGSSGDHNNRNVSLTIDETAIVDGGSITSGIYLSGSKTRETLIVKGKVVTNSKIAILGDKDHGGTTIQIDGGTVTATDTVAIYHPQSGDLIIDGRENQGGVVKATVSGSGAIEMKGGDLTITKDATITATAASLSHTSGGQEDAPSTNGYAIALVERTGFSGVGKVNISKDATIENTSSNPHTPGVIACLVDSRNNAVAAPVFNGDIQMVAETNGEKYASLPNAITACADGGEVKFLDDININQGFTINRSLTIDMDDYSIIGKQAAGVVAITISVGAEDVVILKNGGVTIEKDATVTNNGIKIIAGTVALQQVIVNTKGVSLAVSSGTVTIDAKSSFSSSADNTLALSGGTTTLRGKVYNTSETDGKKNAIAGTGTAVLTADASIVVSSANGYGIDWGSSRALTVNGGKVMGAEAVHASNGTVTIEGGTFTGTGNALNVAGGTPSVTGGTYICGSDNQYAPITAASATGFVSGTSTYFSKKIAQNLCTTGYMVSTNPKTNGYYYLIDEIIINDATVWTVPASEYTIHTAKYVRNSGMGASGTKFGTLCLPFTFNQADVKGLADGNSIEFYAVTSINTDKSEITITKLTGDIAAGTPVIFQFSKTTSSFTIESENAQFPVVDPKTENNLVGTFSGTTLTTTASDGNPSVNDVYYLNGDAFHQATASLTVPAFRAYIKIVSQAQNSARTLYIHTEGSETSDIADIQLDDEVAAVYDLRGRKLNGLQRGVNIMRRADGSSFKVIVK